MELLKIILSKVTQIPKDKYYMFSLICSCWILVFKMCATIPVTTEVVYKAWEWRQEISQGKETRIQCYRGEKAN